MSDGVILRGDPCADRRRKDDGEHAPSAIDGGLREQIALLAG